MENINFGDVVKSPIGVGPITGYQNGKFKVKNEYFLPHQLKKVKIKDESEYLILSGKVINYLITKNSDYKLKLDEFVVFKGNLKDCLMYANSNVNTFLANSKGDVLLDRYVNFKWQ